MSGPEGDDTVDEPTRPETTERIDPATSSLRPDLPRPVESAPQSTPDPTPEQLESVSPQASPSESLASFPPSEQGASAVDGAALQSRTSDDGQQSKPEPTQDQLQSVTPPPPESLASYPPPEQPATPIDGTKLQSRGTGDDPKAYASFEDFRDSYRGQLFQESSLRDLWNKAHPDQPVTPSADQKYMDARGEQGSLENLQFREDVRNEERGRQTERNLQNPGGTIGYALAGDRGSDLGSTIWDVVQAVAGVVAERFPAGSINDRETAHGAPLEREAVRESAPTRGDSGTRSESRPTPPLERTEPTTPLSARQEPNAPPASTRPDPNAPSAPGRRDPSEPPERSVEEAFRPYDGPQRAGPDQPYQTTRNLSSGLGGEKLAAEALAADGHTVLYYKPDITQTNQRGIDAVTAKDGVLYLVDNKALNGRDNISSVTALTDNLSTNVASLSAEFRGYAADPSRPQGERALYDTAANALDRGDYVLLVTNANALPTGPAGAREVAPSGLSQSLRESGLQFYDVRAPLGRDVVDQRGRIERDTTDATSYRVSESFGDRNANGLPEARYRVELEVKDGVAGGDVVLRRDDISGFEGQWHRSSLRGSEEFSAAIEHFQANAPGGVSAIEGRWGGGDNLNSFNRAFTEGIRSGLDTAEAFNWAAQETRTGDWARSLGYGNVEIIDAVQDPTTGVFSQLTIRFTK
jgi:hypothetical protein